MKDPYEKISEMESSADPSDRIVAAIWGDLNDRSGIDFGMFDEEIQLEIIETLLQKVREILKASA